MAEIQQKKLGGCGGWECCDGFIVQVTKISKGSSHFSGFTYSNLFVSHLTLSISWIFFLCIALIFFLLETYSIIQVTSQKSVSLLQWVQQKKKKEPRVLFLYPGLSGPGPITELITVDYPGISWFSLEDQGKDGRKGGKMGNTPEAHRLRKERELPEDK